MSDQEARKVLERVLTGEDIAVMSSTARAGGRVQYALNKMARQLSMTLEWDRKHYINGDGKFMRWGRVVAKVNRGLWGPPVEA
jgi:CO dehydrogenase/acetyl-CoA synthase delta subunit